MRKSGNTKRFMNDMPRQFKNNVIHYIQGDQLNMVVFFRKSYLCTVAYTGQVTFYKEPETHGHVKLVTM